MIRATKTRDSYKSSVLHWWQTGCRTQFDQAKVLFQGSGIKDWGKASRAVTGTSEFKDGNVKNVLNYRVTCII